MAVGETQEQPFQLSFNSSLRVEFQGARVTADGGLLFVRELDERLGFGEPIDRHLRDRRGKNIQLLLAELLRQSVYSRLAGYEDANDAQTGDAEVSVENRPRWPGPRFRAGKAIGLSALPADRGACSGRRPKKLREGAHLPHDSADGEGSK